MSGKAKAPSKAKAKAQAKDRARNGHSYLLGCRCEPCLKAELKRIKSLRAALDKRETKVLAEQAQKERIDRQGPTLTPAEAKRRAKQAARAKRATRAKPRSVHTVSGGGGPGTGKRR